MTLPKERPGYEINQLKENILLTTPPVISLADTGSKSGEFLYYSLLKEALCAPCFC